MIRLTVTENTEQMKKRQQCIRYLATHTVDVGLTSQASGRSRMLLAIHTHGAPAMRIPPRPVVQPALSRGAVRGEMASRLTEACASAMAGDLPGTASALEAAGQAGVDGIHAYIDAGIDPPNAPVTLSGGWIYNRVAKKGVRVSGKQGSTPLKDTGALYNDFDWEIVEK